MSWQALANALDQQRLHHAYLFTGTRGVGKTTIARIFSKALNCEQGISSQPCNNCSTCRSIDEGRFVDLIEVDAASKTKVEDTRELLENVQYAPVQGRYKVYLIDEVHMLSKSSFNALLKTLEEPPAHVKFLLATTDPHKLPITVLSRCLQFNLMRLTQPQIQQHLAYILQQENIPFEESALAMIAKSADGSARDSLSILDQAIAYGSGQVMHAAVQAMLGLVDQQFTQKILSALANDSAEELKQVIQDLALMGVDYQALNAQLIEVFHQISLIQVLGEMTDTSVLDAQLMQQMAQVFAPERVQVLYQTALLAKQDMSLAPDIRIGFEMALLRMLAFQPTVSSQAQLPQNTAPNRAENASKITRPGDFNAQNTPEMGVSEQATSSNFETPAGMSPAEAIKAQLQPASALLKKEPTPVATPSVEEIVQPEAPSEAPSESQSHSQPEIVAAEAPQATQPMMQASPDNMMDSAPQMDMMSPEPQAAMPEAAPQSMPSQSAPTQPAPSAPSCEVDHLADLKARLDSLGKPETVAAAPEIPPASSPSVSTPPVSDTSVAKPVETSDAASAMTAKLERMAQQQETAIQKNPVAEAAQEMSMMPDLDSMPEMPFAPPEMEVPPMAMDDMVGSDAPMETMPVQEEAMVKEATPVASPEPVSAPVKPVIEMVSASADNQQKVEAWIAQIEQLGLAGMELELAHQSIVVSQDAQTLVLSVDPEQQHAKSELAFQRLEERLKAQLGCRLLFEQAQGEHWTPAKHYNNQAAQNQQGAVESIYGDELVNQFVQQLQMRVIDSTIRPRQAD